MDVSPLKDWLGLIALMISVGSSVVLFLKSDAKKASETLSLHGSRIQKLEDDMRHMPDKETVHKLQLDMMEMKGQMGAIVKSSEATERATRRVEEFLLKKP